MKRALVFGASGFVGSGLFLSTAPRCKLGPVKNEAIGICLLLVMLATPSAAQYSASRSSGSSCSEAEFGAATRQAQASRAVLLALPIGDGRQTDVSPDGKHAISAMKESLGKFVNAYMRCAPLNPDTERIKRELSEKAHAFTLPSRPMSKEETPPDLGEYGFQLSFDVQSAQGNRLWSITADFDIECGSDAVLFIFNSDGGAWHEVLRWQSKPYSSIKDAFWSFDSRISPADNLGRWYVVTKHIAPWRSSTWSDISYEALRPRNGTIYPKVLLSGDEFMWWGSEDFGSLAVNEKDFDVRFHSTSIDGGVHNRVWICHFAISGDTVTRVQRVAVSPRDFVDEWLITPWKAASGWSSKAASEQLRLEHEVILPTNKSTDGQFGTIYTCSDAQNHYQVELVESTGRKFDINHSIYFHVVGNNPYTMTGISRAPDPRCAGRDLLEDMSTK
jgi:hypothetical protein